MLLYRSKRFPYLPSLSLPLFFLLHRIFSIRFDVFYRFYWRFAIVYGRIKSMATEIYLFLHFVAMSQTGFTLIFFPLRCIQNSQLFFVLFLSTNRLQDGIHLFSENWIKIPFFLHAILTSLRSLFQFSWVDREKKIDYDAKQSNAACTHTHTPTVIF